MEGKSLMAIADNSNSTYFPGKVAILLASEAIGGEERYCMELAIAMEHSQTKPIVINLKENMPYREELEAHGVIFYCGIAKKSFDLTGAFRLHQLLRDLRADVLLINSNRQALWLGSFLGRLCRIPVVLVHTHTHMGLYAFSLRFVSMIVDSVVAAAEKHQSYLCKVYRLKPKKVVNVYPGIDLSRTAADPSTKRWDHPNGRHYTVGIVAALRPEKDHGSFMQAAARVKEKVPGAQFLIVGDGPRRHDLEELVRKIGLLNSVHFLGWQKVDGTLFEKLDILVLSSLSETFPAVIIEAFSAGIPVVATDVGSVRELLGLPSCGILVPPSDPPALAEAVLRFIKDPGLTRETSERGLNRARFFSADRFCADMLRLSREIFERKRNH
jgi:glycosyltransferase involved in cell wall biosynthesis